jgi:hypothetical protein
MDEGLMDASTESADATPQAARTETPPSDAVGGTVGPEEEGSPSSAAAANGDGGDWANLCRRFGRENLYVLIIINGTNGASLYGVALFLLQYYLKFDLGLAPAEAQLYSSLAILGFALKPLYGTLTDKMPLGGLKFRPYLALSCGCATFGLLLVGLLTPDLSSGMTGVAFLSVGTAWSDLLVNAYSVRVAKLDKDSQPNAAGVVMAIGAGSFSASGALAIPILAVSYKLAGTATVGFLIVAFAQAVREERFFCASFFQNR